MSLFGIGPLELVFILLLVIILIGPNDLRRAARGAGRALNQLYRSEAWRALTQLSRSLRDLPGTLAREAELDELHELRSSTDEVSRSLRDELNGVHDDLRVLDESNPAGEKDQP